MRWIARNRILLAAAYRALRGAGADLRLTDDRRVGDDASFYPVPCWLTIPISPATPAPYRYTGLGLVPLISASAYAFPHGCRLAVPHVVLKASGTEASSQHA